MNPIHKVRNIFAPRVRLRLVLGVLISTLVGTSAMGLWQEPGQTEPREDLMGAAEFRRLIHGGEQANVPPHAMPDAIDQVQRLRTASKDGKGRAGQIGNIPVGPLAVRLASSIGRSRWEWLGPGNIGGRTRSLLIHPTETNVMWIGGVSGGIWKTADKGLTWSSLDDFMASLVVTCMVLDPRNPDRIYVGTGEGIYIGHAFAGSGIFVSENGGRTWCQLTSTNRDDFRFVNRLAFSPDVVDGEVGLKAGEILLAATSNGLFRSTDRGRTFTPLGPPVNVELLDVVFDPMTSAHCLASGRNGRVFYSDDGGESWSPCQGLATTTGKLDGRVELAYARADSNVVYASEDVAKGRVYRSTDGGKSFSLRSSPQHLGYSGPTYSSSPSIGWYANALWAGDPLNPNLVVIGGIDLHRSNDGGSTFIQISDWNDWQQQKLSPHPDQHLIVEHPGYDGDHNRTVFFCNDGGLYRTNDVEKVTKTNGWTGLNNDLGITQFYGAAGNPTTGEIVCGSLDNGTVLYKPEDGPPTQTTGVSGYVKIADGDGGQVAADPIDRIFYCTSQYLRIYRSDNGGKAKEISTGITGAGNNKQALFVAPITLDPNEAKRLYAGGVSLWVTENAKSVTPVWKERRGKIGPMISAIAVASGDANDLWLGYGIDAPGGKSTGAVYRSENALATMPAFAQVDTGLPKRHCTRLVIDPTNHNRVFALFAGYNSDNLWVTVDRGKSWTALGAAPHSGVPSLPAAPVHDLLIHPSDPSVLILGNEVGLFVSADNGATWSPTNQGPTNCAVFKLFMLKGYLVAATHGRGLFRINLLAGPPVPRVPKPVAR